MGSPLVQRDAAAAMFRTEAGTVDAGAFLLRARAVAARMEAGGYLLVLCRDRLAFAVALAAGWMRNRTALLNVDAGQLARVAAEYPGCVAAVDGPPDVALPGVPVLDVRQASADAPGDGGAGPSCNPILDDGHLAAVVFTSGSTGAPTPHLKRWGGLVARSRAAVEAFGLDGQCIVGTVPPQHMYGLETTVLLPFHADVSSWCGPAFFPADVAAAVRASTGPSAPATLVTTPLQLRALLGTGGIGRLAGVISATAPLDPALAAQVEAAWGAPVREIFGATECGSIAFRQTSAGPRWTPYPGVSVRIGPEGAAVDAPNCDTVRLADVLEAEADGFRLLGRRADLVKLGGRRASLPRLNQVLAGVPGVQDGAFVLPDADGARLVAVVVAPEREGKDILAELRKVLEPAFLPRRVIRVERLPRNALGKLPRQALLDMVDRA